MWVQILSPPHHSLPACLPSCFQLILKEPLLCAWPWATSCLNAGATFCTEPILTQFVFIAKKKAWSLPSSPLLPSPPATLPCPIQGKLCFLLEEAVMKPSPMFMVYERTLENCHGYRPRSASIWGPEGAGEKHQVTAPGATQPRIIILKNVYIRGEVASQIAKGKPQVWWDCYPDSWLGCFSLTLLPPAPLLFTVVLNQAKGAEDKMQLRVGSSGKMPRLRAGPTSRPLQSLAAAVATVMAARIRVSRSHGRSCFRPSPELTSSTCSSSSPWGLMGRCGEQGYHSDTETEQTQLGPGDQGLNPGCSSLAVCP